MGLELGKVVVEILRVRKERQQGADHGGPGGPQ